MRGIAKVVTGGGKTIYAFLCVEEYLGVNKEGRVVVLVPTLALADQWYAGFIKDFGVVQADVKVFSGTEKHDGPGLINILTLNSARNAFPDLLEPKGALLIVDECHRAGSPSNSKALAFPWQATLGLSATPEREFDEAFEKVLIPELGEILIDYSYEQAYHDGVICPFKLINVKVPLADHEQEEIAKLTKKAFGLVNKAEGSISAAEALKRLYIRRARVSSQALARAPFAVKIVEDHPGERILLFHEDLSGLTRILNLLTKRGTENVAYHSKVGPSLRRGQLLMFRSGVVDVLGCCHALDEGLNVPETNVGVIASSTASKRQRIQRLGRMLRPAPGKKNAVVYTLYCTQAEETRLREEAARLKEIAEVEWLQKN